MDVWNESNGAIFITKWNWCAFRIVFEKYSGNIGEIENLLAKGTLTHLLNQTESFIVDKIDGTELFISSDVPWNKRQ